SASTTSTAAASRPTFSRESRQTIAIRYGTARGGKNAAPSTRAGRAKSRITRTRDPPPDDRLGADEAGLPAPGDWRAGAPGAGGEDALVLHLGLHDAMRLPPCLVETLRRRLLLHMVRRLDCFPSRPLDRGGGRRRGRRTGCRL